MEIKVDQQPLLPRRIPPLMVVPFSRGGIPKWIIWPNLGSIGGSSSADSGSSRLNYFKFYRNTWQVKTFDESDKEFVTQKFQIWKKS